MIIRRKDIDDIEREVSLERIEEKLNDISSRLRSMDSKQQVWDDIYKITQDLKEKEIQISYEKRVMEKRLSDYNSTLKSSIIDLKQSIVLQLELIQTNIMNKLEGMIVQAKNRRNSI